ncbi:right-handed parallel beta-helix repeat-containing protein [Nocardioides cynanchi]|uniref:right-handed parallel beta-helix repeat-containing protein n=1 Tax=Nocardioides cynanchi TaxID=2558918 RepID=UPI00124547D5|nr:fibronectin type III domain-containing protein [Nocardioides cynanchi]
MKHIRRALGAALATATVAGLSLVAQPAFAEAGPCPGTDNPATSTHALSADCQLSATWVVEDGWSIDGNGHTITADPAGTFDGGALIKNAPGVGSTPATMTVAHLTVDATGVTQAAGVNGITFDGAKGRLNQVTVVGGNLGTAPDSGYGVEITNTVGATFGSLDQVKVDNGSAISGYQAAAVHATDGMRFTVLSSTIADPNLGGGTGAAGILVDGLAHGAITENHIHLTDSEPASPSSFRAGVELEGTLRVEVKRNIFSGTDADFGISVDNAAATQKTTAAVDCNVFARNDSSASDPYGVAVAQWTTGSKTNVQVTNATFQGNWNATTGVVNGTTVTAGVPNVHDGHCPPSGPLNVAALGGDGRSKVTWQAAAAPEWAPLTDYVVKAQAPGQPDVSVTTGPNATSATLAGLKNKVSYVVTVTAESNGGAATGTTRLSATKIAFTAKPRLIHRGATSMLSGKLSSGDPHARLGKRKIVIWGKHLGGRWAKVGTVRTTSKGTFSERVKPRKRTTYRAVYAGHPDLASSHRTTVSVRR